MPFSPTPHAAGRAEVERLVAQIQRIEARSGRRAVRVDVVVPPGVAPEPTAARLAERLGAEVQARVDDDAVVCRIITIDFELLDEPTAEASPEGEAR